MPGALDGTTRWCGALIVVVGLVAYANAMAGPFVLDDLLSILHNRGLQEWRLSGLLLPERDTPFAGRPLVNLTFAINVAIHGFEVFGYHLTNLAIHMLCGLVMFGIVRRTLALSAGSFEQERQRIHIAFASALLWSIHPLNSEVVNYLTQRTESMMALGYLLTFYCAIRAADPRGLKRWGVLSVASCALGMACKESMVSAPLMVILYDRLFLFDSFQRAWRARWRLYAGLAATWLILGALVATGPRGESAGFSSDVTPLVYLCNQAVMITRYLRLAIWPSSLVVWYGWPLPLTVGDIWPYALLIIALVATTVVALIRTPKIGFLGAWVFVTLAPTSSVIPIVTEVGAERRVYLPLMALVVLATTGTALAWSHWRRRGEASGSVSGRYVQTAGGTLLLVAIAACLVLMTRDRNQDYRSTLLLARTAVEGWPSSPLHRLLGVELIAAGNREEGVAHLRTAIAGAPMARYDLGRELLKQGKLDEAIEELRTLVGLWENPPPTHPHWQPPLRVDVVSARSMMGEAYARQQRWPQAIEQYELALSLSPSDLDARKLLGDALAGQQTFDRAIVEYRRYLIGRPEDAAALTRLGISLVALNNIEEAVRAFRRVVELDGGSPEALRNLATGLLDAGDGRGATEYAQRAVALKPGDPALHDLLARTFLLTGNVAEAEAQFKRALSLDPAFAPSREALNRLSASRAPSGRERRRPD